MTPGQRAISPTVGWVEPVQVPCSKPCCKPNSDLGTFKPLPPRVFEKLIVRGRRQAAELDAAIRSQFEMGPEANQRVR